MKERKLFFLSRLIPEKMKKEVNEKMINTMDNASIALQERIIRGMDAILGNNNVTLLNYLPVFSYPYGYKDAFIKKYLFSHNSVARDINLGFCNITGIKRIFQIKALRNELYSFCRENRDNEIFIIAYTPYPEFLKAIKYVKKHFDNIKSCIIIPDIPKFLGLGGSKIRSVYRKYNQSVFDKYKQYVDSYVLLTKQMAEALDIETKPYIVMEGISSVDFDYSQINDNSKDEFTVFYGGTLHKAFGIKLLIDTARLLDKQNIVFEICGIGDYENEVVKYSNENKFFRYLGKLDRKDVLNRILNADIIVNPRGAEGEFTKYSFPSKNLEALSSGVPFVAFKLNGIPDEYDDLINYPSLETSESLAKMIVDIRNNYKVFKEKATKAKVYVNNYKNELVQSERIVRMIEEV